MFSAQDIRDIFHTLPPQDGPIAFGTRLGPSLLMASNQQEFVITEYAFRDFEHIVATAETSRLSAKALSIELEIEPDVVLRFARASPGLVLLSRDNDIIPKNQRQNLVHELQDSLAHELVSKTDFAREHDLSLESMDALLESVQCNASFKDGLTCIDDFVASNGYRLEVSEAIQQQLNVSLKENKPAELFPKLLPGHPPLWYISQILNSVLQDTQQGSGFHISEADVISCVPKESVLRKRDATIAALQAGNTPYLHLRTLLAEFRETFPSVKDVEEHLAKCPEVDIQGNIAISRVWLSQYAKDCASVIKDVGYVDFTSKIKSAFPSECQTELIDITEKHISAAGPGDIPNTQLHRVGCYLITSARYGSDRELLLQAGRASATRHWDQLRETPDKELKFQISNIFDFLPDDQAILRVLPDDRDVKKSVEEAYWAEISRLESENEAAFSAFWVTRVVSRVSNYQQSLKKIDDGKLQGQLSDLLSDYLKNEFVPASITKARSKGLLLSRKTKKQVNKLETALQKPGSLDTVLSTIDKFNSKQGVQELDAPSLASAKQIMIDDLVKWMQKRSDGPTLFLTMVVVLLARCSEGVVYATGKFAPKLMKIVKQSLSAEEYERLEKWKDMTKANSLTEDDKEAMKRWVQVEVAEN